MKKILFPTDFSDVSNNAFIYALQLARHLQAEVVTLHVYEMPIVDYIDVPAYLLEIYDTVELANFENYKSHIPVLRNIAAENNLSDVPISNVLMDGDLLANISEIIRRDGIGYVVMGTKGASGVKETFLGTATASVIGEVDAVVLAIPQHATYKPIREIVFTTRFRDKDQASLRKLLEIARSFEANIQCLHVKTPDTDVKEVVVANWKLLFKSESVQFHIVEHPDVEQALFDFISFQNPDVLAIMHHKRGFFESLFSSSLTKKLAFHSTIPVLALPEPK